MSATISTLPDLARRSRRPMLAAVLSLASAAAQPAPQRLLDALVEQPPLTAADARANSSRFQVPALAESFSFEGTASELRWWGTAGAANPGPGGEFDIRVFPGARGSGGYAPADALYAFAGTASAQAVMLGGETLYEFRLALPDLPSGTYSVSIEETEADNAGFSWYWLMASAGDGRSFVDADGRTGGFAGLVNHYDLALSVLGQARAVAEPGIPALALFALLALAAARRDRPAATRG